MQPVDLTALVGIIFGTSIVLIPVIGFTLRFALKPLVEVWARARAGEPARVERLERRVLELEQHLGMLGLSDPQLSLGISDPTQVPRLRERS